MLRVFKYQYHLRQITVQADRHREKNDPIGLHEIIPSLINMRSTFHKTYTKVNAMGLC